MTKDMFQETIPVAPLKIIAQDNCKALGAKIDQLITNARQDYLKEYKNCLHFSGYEADTFLIDAECIRFGSGEGKAHLKESVRGKDLFIITDVLNRENHYTICGTDTIMSPDDQFQDLKRIISACNGKAKRINIIMPFLYESRQHKRTSRESLDCATALIELVQMGVSNFITFDAHDPRVSNAIPINGFDNFYTSYQFIQALIQNEDNLDFDNMMIVSPDEGGMTRAVYYSNILGVEMGMFYKRRDYTTVVNGRNPIVAHEFLGTDVEGKTVIIVDDMISSGESMLEVCAEMRKRKAGKIIIAVTFGLFSEGFAKFDDYYEKGLIDRIYTTNLTYCPPELLEKPYYRQVDLSRYLALIIHTLNHDKSVNEILNPTTRIHDMLDEYKKKQKDK